MSALFDAITRAKSKLVTINWRGLPRVSLSPTADEIDALTDFLRAIDSAAAPIYAAALDMACDAGVPRDEAASFMGIRADALSDLIGALEKLAHSLDEDRRECRADPVGTFRAQMANVD